MFGLKKMTNNRTGVWVSANVTVNLDKKILAHNNIKITIFTDK